MKFYISESTKKELEDKINQLENTYHDFADWEGKLGEISIYKEILTNSLILPIWNVNPDVSDNIVDLECLSSNYPNGVILIK